MIYVFKAIHYKKTLLPFFMDGIQLHQGFTVTSRRLFTFYHKDTYLIKLGGMKG